MVHNGFDSGLMAAYAEGLNILKNADIGIRDQENDAETAPLLESVFKGSTQRSGDRTTTS
jgi:6-phosphogluconate dehydrogenase (decarboxylating)